MLCMTTVLSKRSRRNERKERTNDILLHLLKKHLSSLITTFNKNERDDHLFQTLTVKCTIGPFVE